MDPAGRREGAGRPASHRVSNYFCRESFLFPSSLVSRMAVYPPVWAERENKVELCLENPPLKFRYQHVICRPSRDSASHNINYGGVEENKVVQ